MSDQGNVASRGQQPLLELSNVSKHFGGVMALKNVDFTLLPGEIHGLVGENGAGKSTTMKIIAGVHTDFDGIMKINGREVRLSSPRDALSQSIGMVHQELSIVPDLTVAENVFLGNQPTTAAGTIDWGRMNREAKKLIASLGLEIDPTTTMGSLPVGLQQLVELSRVLFSGAQIIILDEPTSACRRRKCVSSSRCCAGSAPKGGPSYSSRTSLTTCWRYPTASPCSATARRSSPKTPRT